MRNSVNSPGTLSASILPPCCFTITSWLRDSPRPVPSPAGFVVKNGLNISPHLSGKPIPLSRSRISIRSGKALVDSLTSGPKEGSLLWVWRFLTA